MTKTKTRSTSDHPGTVLAERAARLIRLVVVGCAVLIGAPALAHPSYVTIAQMRHNADAASLEIGIRFSAHDLERAMEHRTGKPFDLEKTPDADALVHRYIDDTFFVRTGDTDENASTEAHVLSWVGFELEDEFVWLYFEVAVPDGIDGVYIGNQVMFEMEPTQANTMNLRAGDFRTSYRCTTDAPWAQIQISKGESGQ
jgi:uncharacterized protein DUF6702